jgi:thiol-disulfide isomerase/thioredoxin
MQFSRQFQTIILPILACIVMIGSSTAEAQRTKSKDKKQLAVIRGKIAYDKKLIQSWDGNRLVIPYQDIEAKIRQKITPPAPPYPPQHKQWTRKQYLEWEAKFVETAQGKKFLEDRKKLLENAAAFDVKFEKDGTFVIYDVPAGTYGIQGRTDREIGETNYGFEVFGEIQVLKDVNTLNLRPMRVEVTPLMKAGQKAPPFAVKTHDDKTVLERTTFKSKYLFLNFWSSVSPTSHIEQKLVQDLNEKLKEKYDLIVLSINIDTDRDKILKYIVDKKLVQGRHGFTGGANHKALWDYGVRSFPSFWLLEGDEIKMSQYEIASMMRIKPDLVTIISDNIEGKGVPTPAEPKKDESKKDASNSDSKKGGGIQVSQRKK